MRTFCLFIALVAAPVAIAAQIVPSARVLSDSQIRSILAERVDKYRQSVGIVVGIIEPRGRRVVSYGTFSKDDFRAVDADTIFEIGSVTKVFTSLLLADMVARGEVALNDPVAKYLPLGVKVPERNGRHITLLDLSTHMSGLPREATNFEPELEDWEAGYSEESLYEFLRTYQLTRDIGFGHEYSNVGTALLGLALARRAGMDYEALVRTRITGPLGLGSTGMSLTAQMANRRATGHFWTLYPAPTFTMRVFAAAGALRSTANDLLTLLAAQLGYQQTTLSPAMASMVTVGRDMMPPVMRMFVRDRQHLGWLETKNLIWHDGGTLGFSSFIGFDPKTRVGVVVLANAHSPAGVDDIGMHLLDQKVPLLKGDALKPAPEHREIPMAPETLERYVGRYEISPDDWFVVARVGDEFLVDGNGFPAIRFYPQSLTKFFSRIGAEVVFRIDGGGRSTELLWNYLGPTKRYKRVQ